MRTFQFQRHVREDEYFSQKRVKLANAMLPDNWHAKRALLLDVFAQLILTRMHRACAHQELNANVSDPKLGFPWKNQWLEAFVRELDWILRISHTFCLLAPCDDGKIYSPTGGSNCQCSQSGSMICITNENAGCYCSSDSYINDQGICTLKSECQGKRMNEMTFTWWLWPNEQINMVFSHLFSSDMREWHGIHPIKLLLLSRWWGVMRRASFTCLCLSGRHLSE